MDKKRIKMKKITLNSLQPLTGNLVDFNLWEMGWYNVSNGTKSVETYGHLRLKNFLKVKPNTTYMISGLRRIVILEYDNNNTYLNLSIDKGKSELPFSFITSMNTAYISAFCLSPLGQENIKENKIFNSNVYNFNIKEL